MVDLLNEQRQIVVYGTGLNAVKWAFQYEKTGGNISYFLNTDSAIDEICGKPVYSPGIRNVKNCYIVVAVSTEKIYLEISQKLQQWGLCEFEDYIYYRWLNKKMVLMHGNCHMTILKEFMKSSASFEDLYAVYPNPAICFNRKKEINETILKNCDVYIHQEIRTDNPYGYKMSDEYIETKINADTFEIVVPNLYNLGSAFFPHLTKENVRNKKLRNGLQQKGIFVNGDVVLDDCVRCGKTLQEIIDYAKSGAALDKEYIVENFNTYMDKIKEREKNCDVKIYDYILENYKIRKLFYDPEHPTNDIIKKCATDVLRMLGIVDEGIHCESKLDAYEAPIYPVIKECLQLKWEDEDLRTGALGMRLSDSMDLDEYIYEYLWWCYDYRRNEEKRIC